MKAEPIDVMIEFIGIMNIYTTLLEAEYLPILTEILNFSDVLQTENSRKTKGNIMYSAVRITGGSLIIAGIALSPVSFGTSNCLTIAGCTLTGGSTIASISHSLSSDILINKRNPHKTTDMFKNPSFLRRLLSKVSRIRECESKESQFYTIEKILEMMLRKLANFEENVGEIYVRKHEFEIEEDIVDNSLKTRIKDKIKRCWNNVKRIMKPVPAVNDTVNNKTGPAIRNTVSTTKDVYNAYSDVKECISHATNPNYANEANQPVMDLVPDCFLQELENGINILHPAVDSTLIGAGMIFDCVSIGRNVQKIRNRETCEEAKTLQEVINSYESDRKEFHKSMHQIAEKIEKQVIPCILNNENAVYHEYQISEFKRLKTFLGDGFQSVFEICNQNENQIS
ncbi:uncharacterized protein LOC134724742 [Mytilus trossulus]|uniref:uncharacterized protein LOC134724742 n=1 Tax=Mytilus trossulus TaxID=6551 RepID=UPI003005D37F